MQTYRYFCYTLWALGLRKLDPEPPRDPDISAFKGRYLQAAHADRDLHFTNWNLLKNRSHYDEDPPPRPSQSCAARWGAAWAYTAAVTVCLCIRPAIFAHRCLRDPGNIDELDVAFLCFMLLIPIQYIQSCVYLSSDHIEPYISYSVYGEDDRPFSSSGSSSIDELILEEDLIEQVQWRPPRAGCADRCLATVCALALVSALAAGVILCSARAEVLEESHVPFSQSRYQWVGRAIAMVDTVYGRVTQALNLTLFVAVFHNHWRDLCFIEKCIEEYVFKKIGTSAMIHHIILVRHSVDASVNKFHGMFSSFTVLGAIGLSCLLHYCTRHPARSAPLYLLTCGGAYLAVQAVYIALMHRLSSQRLRLLELIHHPRITLCCLNRMAGLSMHCDENGRIHYPLGESDEERSKNLIVMEAENASTMDWRLLESVLERRWEEFEICGVRVSDGALLCRCVAIVALVLSGKYLL